MTAGKPPRDAAAARLVERQMRNWELARAQRLSVPAPQRKEVEDFIAVSRAVGAGGVEVAARLGEALSWPVFDREILDVMAGDDEMRRQVYASMDERDMSWFEETASSLLQPEVVKNDYFHRRYLTQDHKTGRSRTKDPSGGFSERRHPDKASEDYAGSRDVQPR